MKHCSFCGGEVSDTARACGHCGRMLVAEPVEPSPTAAPPEPGGVPGWVWGLVGGLAVLAVAGVVAVIVLIGLGDSEGPSEVASMVTPESTVPSATDTPAPTAAPTSELADLVITSVEVSMRGYSRGCVAEYDVLMTRVCVQNRGPGSAEPFAVRGGEVTWEIQELAAGEEECVEKEGTVSEVRVDVYDQVTESNEANNVASVPVPTPPPICTPTPKPTVPPPTPTSKPVRTGKIAFVSYRDGNAEIYVMNPDGSNQRRLTNTSEEEWHPAWSPDGSKLVFQCSVSGGAHTVCVANADGSGYRQIIPWFEGAQRPVWSPDGQKIAVSRAAPGGGKTFIYVMSADGSGQPADIVEGRDPSWSPDGSKIVFTRRDSSGLQIWTTSPDGARVEKLTEGNHFHMYPTWSPDGKEIAFEYDDAQVAVMAAGGGSLGIVADKGSWNLSWSPDGKTIVIAPNGEGLWLVNADGSGLTQIDQEGTQPSWH